VPELFLDPDHAVDTALAGFARLHPQTLLSEDPVFLFHDRPHADRRVAVVSGGGSGHEPMHGGLVGPGMLDAAVPGRVFASPHNRQVYEASKRVAQPGGVLMVVKNYTGDRINFAIAAERLAADGIEVARVLVDDDVATESDDTATGRRGTAATVVVEKVLGAAADTGAGLVELADLGNRVAAHSRSIAVASGALTSFHTGRPMFDLAEGELEYGVGIHGERAAQTLPRPPVRELVTRMVADVMDSLARAGGSEEHPLLVLVNGLGATTELELCTIYELVAQELEARGRRIESGLAGSLVAALDMSGFSITVTELADPTWLDLFHAPTQAPAWPGGTR
jgi:dihydroxyacetone kinase/dihydroxyacetone kinase-like protein